MKTTLNLYCQYLVCSQTNYTCTNLANHFYSISHDSVYRYLKEEKLTPRLIWEKVKDLVHFSDNGYILFDDTVLPKTHSFKIQGVRRQYSGNEHRVIKGIGNVNCVYFDSVNSKYWVIDYRIFDPERDGKSKIDHVLDMLASIKYRNIPFQTVLMDSWYATVKIMKYLMKEGKDFYCPLKKNRKVDESGGQSPYKQLQDLVWSKKELESGKIVKVHKFPKDTYLKLFHLFLLIERSIL